MFKFMLMFKQPADIYRFEDNYNNFLALVERMPAIRRRQVIHITGSPQGPAPYYRILEVYFDDQAALEHSLRTPIGQEAGTELAKFAPGSVELLFAEVFEEEGGQTPG